VTVDHVAHPHATAMLKIAPRRRKSKMVKIVRFMDVIPVGAAAARESICYTGHSRS
jgi:hypothetical protein